MPEQSFKNYLEMSMVNADLHYDPRIAAVKTVIQNFAVSHLERLYNHSYDEISNLPLVPEGIRRLPRVRPLYLAQ